jgi:hypothetical protein
MIIFLTEEQLNYLDDNIKNQEEFNFEWNVKRDNQSITIEIDDDIVDEIRDWAMDKQVEVGFNIDYELNSEGKILEGIIDAFYIE